MSKETERGNAIAYALSRYTLRGMYRPEEQPELEKKARLAASALLELQGIQNPSQRDIDQVLFEL